MMTYKPILYAEDDENDVFFMTRAFSDSGIANPLHIVCDGREAMDYLNGARQFADRRAFPLPFVVMLDLKLPEVPGLDVLAWVREQSRFRTVHVVVLASSREDINIQRAVGLGANTYLLKPPTTDSLLGMVRALGQDGFDRRAVRAPGEAAWFRSS